MKITHLTATLLLCLSFTIAQKSEETKEKENKCGEYLEKCDTNKNGRITCAEARACGLKTPIKQDHPAYNCMFDRDGDGQVCE